MAEKLDVSLYYALTNFVPYITLVLENLLFEWGNIVCHNKLHSSIIVMEVFLYLLNEILFMCKLSLFQCPPGMKQQVLLFFANLLGKMKQPLLPHVNVYRPVHVSTMTFFIK